MSTLHSCAPVLVSSGLRPELQEGPDWPERRMHWWRIQFASGWSCSATHRSQNPGRKGLYRRTSSRPSRAACQQVGVLHWIHVVDCVTCVDVLESTHIIDYTQWTPKRKTIRKRLGKLFFLSNAFLTLSGGLARCCLGWVPFRRTFIFECPKRCSTVSDSH